MLMKRVFDKKGQIALFVIIGLLLVGSVIVVFLSMKNDGLDLEVPIELQGMDSNLDDCIEQRAVDAIWLIGLSGGYVEFPLNSIETPLGNISYGLKNKRNVLVDKKTIVKEISDYLTFATPYCINPEDYFYNVTFKDYDYDAEIYDDYVRVDGNVNFKIEKDSYVESFEREYSHNIPIRLGRILSAGNLIVEQQRKAGDKIPLEFVSNFDADIMFEYIDDNNVVYIIHDNQSKIDDISYNFLFATELNNGDLK